MDHSKQLGEEKVIHLLFKFSIPAIIGMLVNALYNIIDRVFVGRGVGELALSSVSIVFPIPLILMAFGMLIGMGATSLVSIRLGQNRREEARRIVGNSFILLIIACLFISLICFFFMDDILVLLGATAEVLPYARDFISVLLWGAVFQGVGFGMNNLIRAEGNPQVAMFTMLLGAGLNTILNPIFIFGLGIGIKGSALATVISQFVSAVWVMTYFLGKRSLLKITLPSLILSKDIAKGIVAIGFSPFMMQLVGSMIMILLNKQLVVYGGNMAIAAMAVINSVVNLIIMPAFGINQGVQPIIGFNYGAKKYGRVEEAVKYGAIGATIVMVLGFLMVEIFPAFLMKLFVDDPQLIQMGAEGMRIYLCSLPIVGFQFIGSGYFQATGQPRKSLFLSLSRQLIFLVPLIYFLPSLFGLALDGIWLSGPISDLLSAIVASAMVLKDLNKLRMAQTA